MAACTNPALPPLQYDEYESPLGRLTLAAAAQGLCGVWFVGQKYFPALPAPGAPDDRAARHLLAARDWLDRYFAGRCPPPPAPEELPLAPQGSAFRQCVWRLLCQVPYGSTTTYGALAAQAAAQLGRPRLSAQAVGGAVGHNPVSILIPCHRVVGTNGSLIGYAGGIEKKIKLLALEKVDVQAFRVPKKGTAL